MAHLSEVTLPLDQPEFILTRVFDAPRALLWKCWMEPSYLARWWGPKSFTCPVCEVDAQVGGKFRLVIRGPDGSDYPMSGIFREIVPNVRIVKEDDVSGHSEEWHDMVDPDRRGQGKRRIELTTTVTFEDHGNGTKVTIRTAFPTLALRDNFAKAGMKEGWNSGLEKLDDLVFAVGGSDKEIKVTRLIGAPIDRVFACFSDPVGKSRWWGPNGFTTTTHKQDFRVGGVWDYTMHGPDGTDYPNYVRYTEITPPFRIAYDHGSNAQHPDMFKAVITFAEENGKTRVTLHLTLKDAKQREDMVAFGAVEGGWQTLSRLEDFIATNSDAQEVEGLG
jgi:uncharacterized protein YndB with AHSA1/START domain